MNNRWEKIEGGLWGLLVGDALGVPFEFCHYAMLPEMELLDYELPKGYAKSHANVPVGTWSDDGAQSLCLLLSLVEDENLNLYDFAERLIRWYDQGYLTVDGYAFDVGNQTCESLNRIKAGVSPWESGLKGSFNNGNGSLMRCLPIALMHRGSEERLIELAHKQSVPTHAHRRSLVCCALYTLWAWYELSNPLHDNPPPWDRAVQTLKNYYQTDPLYLHELENEILPYDTQKCRAGSYVVDTLHSVRLACEEPNFEAVIKRALKFGNDTDTVASLAGGIAGIRHKMKGIPYRWKSRLRGMGLLFPILQKLCLLAEDGRFDEHEKEPILELCIA